MNRPRRVAVTAPPDPGVRPRPVPPRPVPETLLDPARAELARSTRRAQVRRAALTLVCGALLLLGVPVLLRLAPGLSQWRPAGLPLGWILVAWVPYPLLALLAWWHLRGAERAERAGREQPGPVDRPAAPPPAEPAEPAAPGSDGAGPAGTATRDTSDTTAPGTHSPIPPAAEHRATST